MKSEAERRFEAFWKSPDAGEFHASGHALRHLFRALLDPLPSEPEPEPVKSLGQIASEARPGPDLSPWAKMYPGSQENWENIAAAVVKEHEARRPKPTVEDVARAQFQATNSIRWEGLDQYRRDAWLRGAAAVFPLFGVTP